MPKLLLSLVFSCLIGGISAQSYFLQGTAIYLGDDCYRLTTELGNQNGAVWYADQIDLTEPFDISFQMNLGDIDGNGADGICFVLQTVGTGALGTSGGGLGFLGFSPAFGIEFDTWQNGDYGDPVYDHIGMISNGDVSHLTENAYGTPVQTDPDNMNVEDGEDHDVRIVWYPENQTMAVYWDCEFRTSQVVNLVDDIFNGETVVYWGFTAATGGSFNNQIVCLQEDILTSESDVFLCEGGSIELGVGGDPNGEFLWSPETYLDDPNSATPLCDASEDISYTVVYTDLCGQESESIINVDVEALELDVFGGQLVSCATPTATLTASNNLGDPSTYNWSTNNGSFVTGTGASSVVVDSAGVYTVTVSYDGQCEAVIDYEVEANFDTSEITILEEGELTCYSPEGDLLATADGTVDVFWTDANGNVISTADEASSQLAGNYTFHAIHPISGCETMASAEIVDNIFYPEVFAGFSDTLSCTEPTIQIEGASVSPEDVSISWIANPGLIIDGESSLTPVVALEGTYMITATINSNGCESSATVEIFEDENTQVDFSTLVIPNVFSPNNDGVNDAFTPYLSDDEEMNLLPLFDYYDLKVFNRWGSLIFDSNGRPLAWDGRDTGNEVNEGVYYFVLDYSSYCGGSPEEPIHGIIHLLR